MGFAGSGHSVRGFGAGKIRIWLSGVEIDRQMKFVIEGKAGIITPTPIQIARALKLFIGGQRLVSNLSQLTAVLQISR